MEVVLVGLTFFSVSGIVLLVCCGVEVLVCDLCHSGLFADGFRKGLRGGPVEVNDERNQKAFWSGLMLARRLNGSGNWKGR